MSNSALIATLKARRKADKSDLENLSMRISAATPAEARTLKAEFNDGIAGLDTLAERIEDLTEQDARSSAAAGSRVATGGARFTTNGPQVYNDPHQNPESPSFFRDLRDSRLGNRDAADRLQRNQQARASESRAISTTAGAGGQFAPPLWLVEDFIALARPGRIAADLLNRQELPSAVSSVNLPKVATGATTAVQALQNTAISNTDLTSTSVSSGISTIAGQQVVSLQLLQQSGIPFDKIILEDLAFDFARALDLQVITGSGASGQLRGLENGASVGVTTFTSASPAFVSTTSANSFYNRLIAAVTTVNTTRFLPPTAIVMHPNRWAWVLEALDTTTRPLVLTAGGSFNAAGLSDGAVADGSVGSLLGLPVYTDNNIPTTKGVSANQDEVLILRGPDVFLYESELQMESFEATYAAQASVLFRVLGYSAMLPDRYSQSVNIISGTGLIAPTL